jgi:hypothetical protein
LLPAQDNPFEALPAAVWYNARRNGLVMIHHFTPTVLSSRTQITRANEPGDPLIVGGRVFAPDGRTPAPGVTVYAYNSDAQGYYGEKHKEYPPRIYGSNEDRPSWPFRVAYHSSREVSQYAGPRAHSLRTVGRWVSSPGNRRLKFAGDRFLTPDAYARDLKLGDFRPIQPLTRAKDNPLHCTFRIRLQPTTTFH